MWWLESEKPPPLVCQLLMGIIMECNENHINDPVRTATPAYSEDVEVRDLTPKSDGKGGATKPNKDKKDTFPRTGEMDFMGP